MKRFMLIVLTALIFLSLTACSGNLGQRLVDLVTTVIVAPFADTEAELSITTTDGRSRINKAYLNPRYSNCHPIKVTIVPGQTLTYHFECQRCGTSEEGTVTFSFNKLFVCKCPKYGNKQGYIRGYITLVVLNTETSRISTEANL